MTAELEDLFRSLGLRSLISRPDGANFHFYFIFLFCRRIRTCSVEEGLTTLEDGVWFLTSRGQQSMCFSLMAFV